MVCNGAGKVPIYYTTNELEEKTGKLLFSHTIVWGYYKAGQNYTRCDHMQLQTLKYAREMNAHFAVVVFPYQIPPPSDYRSGD